MSNNETKRWMPSYHFVIHGNGNPGDSNGAFWSNGRYHLMYLVCRQEREYSWGHVSSTDMIHWENHPDAIGPASLQPGGCYSGGGFIDDDGTAYLTYWMLWDARGIGMAKSKAPFDKWELLKQNPVVQSHAWGWSKDLGPDGKERIYASADPSNIWKENGKYYFITGNLLVLNQFGRNEDSPEHLRGDCAYLFESDNLTDWTYKCPFYQRHIHSSRAEGWTDPDEDCMCPSFLPLATSSDGGEFSGKYLLLFISHNRGCQYYIGSYNGVTFIPESHGRMTWQDKSYFAPEALVDGKGRQIAWTWLNDNPVDDFKRAGWSGVYGLPRSLWLRKDGTLGIAPVEEIKQLRTKETNFGPLELAAGTRKQLTVFDGTCCELELEVPYESATKFELLVQASPDAAEKTVIRYDSKAGELVMDSTGNNAEKINDFNNHVEIERAPFVLDEGESLSMRVFVDGPIVEIFVNDRQAITRRVFTADNHDCIFLASTGNARIANLTSYDMK